MYAINKHTGVQVWGTLEQLHGVAETVGNSFRLDADGKIESDYEGGTEIFWDTSTTEKKGDQVVYVDKDGTELTQDDIVLSDELPAVPE